MKNRLLKKHNKIIAVCLVLFGVLYLYAGRSLSFGAWSSPQTGFMPKVSGVGMVILALINLITEMRQEDEVPEDLRQMNWWKAFLYIATCAVYVGMLQIGFGYVIATPICLFAMIKFTGIKSWRVPILTSLIVTLFFYGIFNVIMGVYLPRVSIF